MSAPAGAATCGHDWDLLAILTGTPCADCLRAAHRAAVGGGR